MLTWFPSLVSGSANHIIINCLHNMPTFFPDSLSSFPTVIYSYRQTNCLYCSWKLSGSNSQLFSPTIFPIDLACRPVQPCLVVWKQQIQGGITQKSRSPICPKGRYLEKIHPNSLKFAVCWALLAIICNYFNCQPWCACKSISLINIWAACFFFFNPQWSFFQNGKAFEP